MNRAGPQHRSPGEDDGKRLLRIRVRVEKDETAVRRDIVR
jgi:hypothetical protein